jgi:hypothetical protein
MHGHMNVKKRRGCSEVRGPVAAEVPLPPRSPNLIP